MKTILICGLQRSGSTALFNVIRLLFERRGHHVYSCTATQYQPQTKADLHLIKTHYIPDELINRFTGQPISHENDVLFATSHRDPRDAAASAVRMGWTTDETADKYMELVFKWYETSEKLSVLNVRYEDFKTDPKPQIRYVADSLGFETDDAEIEAIAEALEAIKTKKVSEQYDRETLMLPNHIGKGEIGIYKEILSEETAQTIAENHRDWMTARGYL